MEGAFHILHETPAFASLEASFLGSDVQKNGLDKRQLAELEKYVVLFKNVSVSCMNDLLNVHIIVHQFSTNFTCSFWGVDVRTLWLHHVPKLFRPCRRISRRFPLLHGWKCEGPASSWQRPVTFSAFLKVDVSRYNVDIAIITPPPPFFLGRTKNCCAAIVYHFEGSVVIIERLSPPTFEGLFRGSRSRSGRRHYGITNCGNPGPISF